MPVSEKGLIMHQDSKFPSFQEKKKKKKKKKRFKASVNFNGEIFESPR
jgi:hypothetical protein